MPEGRPYLDAFLLQVASVVPSSHYHSSHVAAMPVDVKDERLPEPLRWETRAVETSNISRLVMRERSTCTLSLSWSPA